AASPYLAGRIQVPCPQQSVDEAAYHHATVGGDRNCRARYVAAAELLKNAPVRNLPYPYQSITAGADEKAPIGGHREGVQPRPRGLQAIGEFAGGYFEVVVS